MLGPRHHSWHDLALRQTKAKEITYFEAIIEDNSDEEIPFADVMAKLLGCLQGYGCRPRRTTVVLIINHN